MNFYIYISLLLDIFKIKLVLYKNLKRCVSSKVGASVVTKSLILFIPQ